MNNPFLIPVLSTLGILVLASCGANIPLTAQDPLVRNRTLPKIPVIGNSDYSKGLAAGKADGRIKRAARPGYISQSLQIKNSDAFRRGYMRGYRVYNADGESQAALPRVNPHRQPVNRRRNL